MAQVAERPQLARAEALQSRLRHIADEVASGRMSRLEGEFLTLLSQEHASPEARQDAIHAWQAENGAALKAERDAERARLQPQRDARRAEMLAARRQHVAAERAAGRMSRLEAEFMMLVASDEPDSQARQQAIRAWQAEKGAALEAEKNAERARLQPLRDAQRAKMLAARRQHIAEELAAGRIGELEAELLDLMGQELADPQAHQASVRAWQEENGEALEAEQAARRTPAR